MSPVGDLFRQRLRMFPNLVNCFTIDWISNWSEEALFNVAKGSIQSSYMNLGAKEDDCYEMFKTIHQSVEQKSNEFFEEQRRFSYNTPANYLDFISMYKKVLTEKRKNIATERSRLMNFLESLNKAATEIESKMKTLTNAKLIRAKDILSSLESEEARQTMKLADLTDKQDSFVGDCLISAGMVSYAGPFTSKYRESLVDLWHKKCMELKIKVSDKYTLIDLLSNEAEVK